MGVRAGSACENETHIFEIASQNLVLFLGHGGEGKLTHLCWVVRYIWLQSQGEGNKTLFWGPWRRGKPTFWGNGAEGYPFWVCGGKPKFNPFFCCCGWRTVFKYSHTNIAKL